MSHIIDYKSQVGQDKFVLNATQFKKDGFFVEFGSQDPIQINNTYVLEKEFGWKGLMFEWDSKFAPLYEKHRSEETIFIIEDATQIDYKELFAEVKLPHNMDYLQIDLESGMLTSMHLLQKLDNEVLDNYKFATVTFEHDIYCSRTNSKDNVGCAQNGWQPFDPQNFNIVREKSRKIFENRGYVCVFEDVKCSKQYDNPFEDWWVHPDLVDMNHIENIIDLNADNFDENDVTELAISGPNIKYE